jgi:hypothetical protein
MNMWRVGEDMGSKEMEGCPLTNGGSRMYFLLAVVRLYIL